MKELLNSAKESAVFLCVCAAIIAGIIILAILAQKYICKMKQDSKSTRSIALTAMFSALAGVLMLLEIPLPFAPSFYKLDLSEIPVLICSFFMGPVSGVVCELVKVLIKLLLKGTTTAFVGDFANFVVGCTFVLPASVIYHARHHKATAVLGAIVGTGIMTIFGSFFNAVYLLPKFSTLFGMPLDAIVAMGTAINPKIDSVSTLVLLCVVPFNVLKGVIDSVIAIPLYGRLRKIRK